MIDITFRPETYELELTGHAGHGVKGEDIVCSAISTLFYTLGKSLIDSSPMLLEEPIIRDEEGNGYICCHPKEEYVGYIARTYWTILTGIKLVMESYQEYINFTIEE